MGAVDSLVQPEERYRQRASQPEKKPGKATDSRGDVSKRHDFLSRTSNEEESNPGLELTPLSLRKAEAD